MVLRDITQNKAYQARQSNPLISSPSPATKPVAPVVAPVSNPTVNPVVQQPKSQQNFGMGSAEGGRVNSTIATRVNPVLKIKAPKSTVDYSTLDKGGLQDELARMTFRMKTGKVTEDDAVNYNRLTRMLKDQENTLNTSEVERLKAEQDRIRAEMTEKNARELEAFKQMQQAQAEQRIADIQEGGAKQREAAQAATSFSGFGRSTVNAEQQASIEKDTQRAIQYEKAAAALAVEKEQARLQGASTEVLSAYDEQIAKVQGEASLAQQKLAEKSNIILDINDEAALKQFVSIARNADGSVNEEVIASLPVSYQAIVRAGVASGLGKTSTIDRSKVKFQRIGGTNKAPIYGYIDPVTGEVKQASGGQVALMQGSSGGRIGGGTGGIGGTTGIGGVNTDGVQKKDLALVNLLGQYKNVLDETSYLGLKTDANKQAEAQNLLSQITAEYKNAKKLGTLDTGVQRLIDGLVGKGGGLLSLSSYSNDAQSNAVKGFIESLGGQVSTPTVQPTTTKTTTPVTSTTRSKYKAR